MMEWGAAIAAAIGIIALVLKQYYAGAPNRMEEERDEDIQQGRRDIADGDVDAVNERIDRLLPSEDSGPAREHNPIDLTFRVSNSTGARILPGPGDTGKAPGKS